MTPSKSGTVTADEITRILVKQDRPLGTELKCIVEARVVIQVRARLMARSRANIYGPFELDGQAIMTFQDLSRDAKKCNCINYFKQAGYRGIHNIIMQVAKAW